MESMRAPLSEVDINVNALPRRKRPGPKPKSLDEGGIRKSIKPISQVKRSYSKSKKIDVLSFLTNYCIYDNDRSLCYHIRQDGAVTDFPYRQPTVAEASKFFNISESTIQDW
jgi:hypothetical protein